MCAALGTQLSAQEKLSNEEVTELVWSNYLLNSKQEENQCVIDKSIYTIDYYDETLALSLSLALINVDTPLYGDLNDDGLTDFIVYVQTNGGGTAIWGQYCTFIGTEKHGEKCWVYSGSQVSRGIIFYELKQGILFGYQTKHDEDDSNRCPSLNRDVIYKWGKDKLIVVSEKEWVKESK